VKELLQVLSLIHITWAVIVIDWLNIDVGKKSIGIDIVRVTKAVFSWIIVRMKV
jgi:hypothetical protein